MTTTPHPAGALANALVQLPGMQWNELTVLAATADALARTLAPAPAAKLPQFAHPERLMLPAEPRWHPSLGWARCRSPQESLTRGAPGGGGAVGPERIDGGEARQVDPPRSAVETRAERFHSSAGRGTAESDKAAPRLSSSGRLSLCRIPLVDPELFGSRAYRRRLGPTVRGLLYAAGCEGLSALARGLDEPLYKIGVTEGATTAMRLSMLAATRYGSVVRGDGGWREEVGFDHWKAAALPLTQRRGRNGPVGAALGAIAFERPISLPPEVLDRALAEVLAPASLAAHASSLAERAAYGRRGLDPADLARYSPAPHGCPQGRIKRARELVMLGPRADADRLAAVLEMIIAVHVMGSNTGDPRHGAATAPESGRCDVRPSTTSTIWGLPDP